MSKNFCLKSNSDQIEIFQSLGKKPSQQDNIIAGVIKNKAALENPENFLAEEIAKRVEEHKNYRNGTTLCAAIAKKNKSSNSVDIITANLGDSLAAVILKVRKADNEIEYRSILLTRLHSLDDPEVIDYVTKNGGRIRDNSRGAKYAKQKGEKNIYSLNISLGAAIGDKGVIGDGEDFLMRAADIWSFNSQNFVKQKEVLLNLDLLVGCDGLLECAITTDEKASMDREKCSLVINPYEQKPNLVNLSSLKKEFDNQTFYLSFARYLQLFAQHRKAHDNVSVAVATLIADEKIVIGNDTIFAAVGDGHGNGINNAGLQVVEEEMGKDKIAYCEAYIESCKQYYENSSTPINETRIDKIARDEIVMVDSAIVSASVLARMAVALQLDCVVSPLYQPHLFCLREIHSAAQKIPSQQIDGAREAFALDGVNKIETQVR